MNKAKSKYKVYYHTDCYWGGTNEFACKGDLQYIGSTVAVSEKQAINNVRFRARKDQNINAILDGCSVYDFVAIKQ